MKIYNMETSDKILGNRLVRRLWVAFIFIILLMGACYILITGYYAQKHNQATIQRLNSQVANHLIEEKFKNASPFLENGSVNKPLFGDIMHDMMSVNRSIEVYLLDHLGTILYSVVLTPEESNSANKVDLIPIKSFIENKGQEFILGDDPRNIGEKKIFSAAPYISGNHKGFVYIILEGEKFQLASTGLLSQYFLKLGAGATLLTMLFAVVLGFLSIWFLTKNLRLMISTIKKFREGDLTARIKDSDTTNIEVFADSFNDMADTIVGNMEKIQSVDALRRELIANVSHDLRTPLAILKGYVETLQIKKDSLSEAEKEEYLNITHNNIDKLSNLINQLFEYSKLESEQVTPVKEPFSITELSYDLIDKFKVISAKKEITLTLDSLKENSLVHADVSMVERALQNLIENAIKYTEPGGKVTLSIKKLNNLIEINISDTGSGIPVSEQPFIFDRYKQVDKTQKKRGAGLGLAIVKKIMELHDTTITVLSQPAKGSTFSFKLPIFLG